MNLQRVCRDFASADPGYSLSRKSGAESLQFRKQSEVNCCIQIGRLIILMDKLHNIMILSQTIYLSEKKTGDYESSARQNPQHRNHCTH